MAPEQIREAHRLSRSSKLIVAVVVVAAIVLVAVKPVGVFGWDAESLSSSLDGQLDEEFGTTECRETETRNLGRQWRCKVETEPGARFDAVYWAFPGDNGCWTAQDGDPDADPRLPSVSECVGLLDLINAIG